MIVIMSEELIDCLKCYPHRMRNLHAGAHVFLRDARVRHLYVVHEGSVELQRTSDMGTFLVLQRAVARSVLAEASVYSERYHCDAVVVEPARLLVFSKTAFLQAIANDQNLAGLWGAYLAGAIQNARQRAEIMSRKSVAERLDGWLAMNDGDLLAKGQWKHIATDIGVTPEALYRELARRR